MKVMMFFSRGVTIEVRVGKIRRRQMKYRNRVGVILITAVLFGGSLGFAAPHGKVILKQLKQYDADGYPENKAGQLIWLTDSVLGRYTFLKGRDKPTKLYYQFRNLQRDAIILSRWDDVTDNLPDGRGLLIRRGYGVLKYNSVMLTGLKGEIKPHFGDNIKHYEHFTIKDWLLGFGISAIGPEVELRHVLADSYVLYANAAVNLFSGLELTPLYGSFSIKAGIGVGARLPAPIQLPFIGKHYWGVYLDMALGFGTENSFIPGIFIELTKCTYGDRSKKRPGGLPYNYEVSDYFLRFGYHFDTRQNGSGASFNLSIGYRFSIKGSTIPAHKKKTTKTVYLHPEYKKQKARERGE